MRSRPPAASQPGGQVVEGSAPGRRGRGAGESPAPAAGQHPGEPSLQQSPTGRGSRELLGAAPGTKTPALLCSLSLNWKDHIFPTVYTLGSSGAPFKGRGWWRGGGLLFHFLCFPELRLGRGLWGARAGTGPGGGGQAPSRRGHRCSQDSWKPAHAKFSEAPPAPFRHLGKPQRGRPVRGGHPQHLLSRPPPQGLGNPA